MIPRKREPTTLVPAAQEPLKLVDVDVLDLTIVWDNENTVTLRVWPGDSINQYDDTIHYASGDGRIHSKFNTINAKEVRDYRHIIQLRADEFRGTAHAMEMAGGA